jgi:lysophospholipase L1-like esterase
VRRSRLLTGAAIAVALAATTATALTAAAGATGTASVRTLPAVRLLAPPAPVRYVALGDSYAAGTGAGDDGSSAASCEHSANSYPEQWAHQHVPASFASATCDGGTTSGVLHGQLTALNARTTLVSITIGGNDAGFSHVMETCVLQFWDNACQQAVASAGVFIAGPLPGRLDATLQAIRARAPSARVVVVGYPDPYDLSRSADCIGLSTADRTALDQAANDLDQALSAAAARNDDVFADVRPDFAGHEICDSASWLYSVTFPFGDSYHPTAAGQELGYLPAFTTAAG